MARISDTSDANDSPSSYTATARFPVVYEVCISPACLADGAERTLEMFRAIAPPHVFVQTASCSSFCGKGPVVDQKTVQSGTVGQRTKSIRHRRVSGGKILDLLESEGLAPEVIQGYEFVLQADEAFLVTKDYHRAVSLYEKAVSTAFGVAVEMQAERDRVAGEADKLLKTESGNTRKTRLTQAPLGLEWLVRARRNEALAYLELDDVQAAILAAQASCNLSRNTSTESFKVLAQAYQRKGDGQAELETLRAMFAVPLSVDENGNDISDESSLPSQQQNERRTLRFRMTKLEKDLVK